jgi:5-methylcytosine-specific restriction enzyme A
MATPEQHRNRPPWHKWYGTARWQRKRALQLKQFPLCKMCFESGIVMAANVADHVSPHHGDEQAFWNSPLQSLCKNHHESSKQQIEKKGFIKDIGTDGFPIDTANHPFWVASRKQEQQQQQKGKKK